MPSFGKRSLSHLATCHEDLQIIAHDAIKLIDFVVIEGHRDQKKQNQMFLEKKSQLKWPKSLHNKFPSLAFDLAPLNSEGRIDWEDKNAFIRLSDIIFTVADFHHIPIYWGGSWKTFIDMPHFELIHKKPGGLT